MFFCELEKNKIKKIQKILNFGAKFFFIIFAISFFWRPPLPNSKKILPEISRDPVQKKTTRGKFIFEKNKWIID